MIGQTNRQTDKQRFQLYIYIDLPFVSLHLINVMMTVKFVVGTPLEPGKVKIFGQLEFKDVTQRN